MIIAHFFTRKVRGVTYLMMDSSSTPGLDNIGDVVRLFRVEEGDRVSGWISRARKLVEERNPDLFVAHVTQPKNSRDDKVQVFDFALQPRAERKTLIQRILGK